MKQYERICKNCKKIFLSNHPGRNYCSKECKDNYHKMVITPLKVKRRLIKEKIFREVELKNYKEKQYKAWTEEEVEYLINNYYNQTLLEIAKAIGRTKMSVNHKVMKLIKEGVLKSKKELKASLS